MRTSKKYGRKRSGKSAKGRSPSYHRIGSELNPEGAASLLPRWDLTMASAGDKRGIMRRQGHLSPR
ncbi:hypothetical protein WJ0W_001894 [Paenibacillus melissococcoides]|uniref:Uncharacterized protein n=1 Tax=Paenibacillus melissococcoides TaxID=2912268 RepID=A0ABM9FZD1_9BACL|nr:MULTISPECIES: hypothetical protein [Paenibacillus]MEB9892043.1 hypothetical protein [Bacillus cereus]CAH8244664.1 hypothetical protein WJ0W_001894 [Paenibacillus melissococcoides]CAH8708636.1 hypothetical protein WDD9_001978 [Paenibacillus melissococcoides]CAH8709359.1 hypothetical protein HTL2_002264 [Paenibacillus melissococcoides]